jgi:hypothetical protein
MGFRSVTVVTTPPFIEREERRDTPELVATPPCHLSCPIDSIPYLSYNFNHFHFIFIKILLIK